MVVVASIRDLATGRCGRGESVPYGRYGERPETTLAEVEALRPAIEAGADRTEVERLLPAGAARNAIDCALWDLEAKISGRSVAELLGLPAPAPVLTAETIGLGTAEEMAAAGGARADRPLLKVKVGPNNVVECLAAVRQAAPRPRLIIDANEAWSAAQLLALIEPLAALGVSLIEQPLPAGEDRVLAGFRPPLTLCADESCHTAADVARLADRYQAVNVKLDKAGGLTEALRVAAEARQRGLGLMVGCMVSTSLAIAPALLLAANADVVDLDGPLWLREDRQPALHFERGWIAPASRDLWG